MAAPSATPSTSTAGGMITSGTFKGYTSAQLSAYFKTLPGPTSEQIAASVPKGLNGQPMAGGRGGAVGPTIPYSKQQQAFLDAIQFSNWSQPNGFDKFMSVAVPIVTAAGVGGAFAPVIAGAVGAESGSIAAGAVQGGITGATSAGLTGQNVGKGALTGAVGGGVGAAVNGGSFMGSPGSGSGLSSSLSSSTGLNNSLSAGVVKGAAGAGVGAVGAKLSGGNVSNAALSGGVGGFLSGAVGNATGSSALGKVASRLGGAAISPLLSGGGSAPATATAVGASGVVGGQGNIGNMAGTATSTDTSLAGTITGALPGVIQAGVGTAGSLAAANAQVGADQSAITTQQQNLGNINNIWATQQGLGQGADTSLGSALGTNGSPANYSGFENMPGYQFAQQQGTQAIQRQAAAMGNAYTPNTAAAVGQYVTGTAMQDYNTYISQLMGAAGLGTTANQGLQTGSQQSSNNISQLQQNQGQATAAGISGVTSAVGGLFSPSGSGTGLLNGVMNGNGTSGGTGSGVNVSTPGFGSSNGGFSTNGDVSGGVNASGVPNDLSSSTTPDTSGVFDTSGGAVDTNNWLSDGSNTGTDFLGGGF